ncbi:MAG: DUF4298 domain-containing protein [Clostridia bacterium]|nr:DUF4298 domain-containing protein [Clostridia bacterium]
MIFKKIKQILRIAKYEKKLNKVKELLSSGKSGKELKKLVSELEAYYLGPLWKSDYADDEAGLLPKSLKRGVLSQDEIYNILEIFGENE